MFRDTNDHVERLWPRAGELELARKQNAADWQRYDFASEFVVGKEVLDCACGAGYGSWRLAQAGALRVVGADVSEEALAWATREFRSASTEFRSIRDGRIPVGDSEFDVVVSFETIEHIEAESAPNFVDELSRVLKPSGTLIMSTPITYGNGRFHPKNPFHLREYEPEELAALLENKFLISKRLGQHSEGSWQYANVKRLPGIGTLVRRGIHRMLPAVARDSIRKALSRSSRGNRVGPWISEERWSDGAVQIIVAQKRA